MSDEGLEPLYDEDGTHTGWTTEAEDGAIVALDVSGTEIVGALDPGTGELIDHTDYELADEDPYADLQAQHDQPEARFDQPREVIHTHQAAPLSQDDVLARWALEKEILESPGGLGRPVTQREVAELGEEAATAGHFSLIQAAEERADRGEALRDIDLEHPGASHEARVRHMGELLAERSGTAPDPLTGQLPRQAEEYDRSTNAGRQAMIEDAVAGYDVRGRDVDDSSYPTTDEDWQHDID